MGNWTGATDHLHVRHRDSASERVAGNHDGARRVLGELSRPTVRPDGVDLAAEPVAGPLDGIIFHMNIPNRARGMQIKRGQLDYFDGGSVEVGPRVGCRVNQPGVPGPDLAALCLRSAAG